MSRTIMILADPRDAAALDFEGLYVPGFDRTFVRTVDFARLKEESEALQAEAQREDVALVLYARNDQVFERYPIGPSIRAFKTVMILDGVADIC